MRKLAITAVCALSLSACGTTSDTAALSRCVSDYKQSVSTTQESIDTTKKALAVGLTWKRRYYMLKRRDHRG